MVKRLWLGIPGNPRDSISHHMNKEQAGVL
jgi:hypothetical protein